jgi:FtsH-binding integral membrane protein
MTQSQYPYASPSQLGVRPTAALSAGFLTQSFAWMFVGLLLTAAVAWVIQGSETLTQAATQWYLPVVIGQLVLVIVISAGITRLSATAALGLFLVYSAMMGVTLSFIFIAYELGSIVGAFVSAAGMFGAAAVYGAVTKRSLATLGGYLFMGLIGIIIASLVNLFLIRSESFSLVISVLGVILFVGLTAWHVQRIARGDLAAYTGSMEKGAVLGALSLYLDFINIFLFLLRIFGGRR